MEFIKNNLLKIVIAFIIFILSVLSIYTLVNYKSTSTNNDSPITSGSAFNSNASHKNNGNFKGNSNNGPNNGAGMQNSKDNKGANAPSNGGQSNNSKSMNPPSQSKNSPNMNSKDSKGMAMGMPNSFNSKSSDSKYSSTFIAFTVIFFTLFIVVYLLITYKKIKISNENEHILILGMIVSGILLRIFLGLLIDGQPFDINIYKRWATSAASNLLGIYNSNASVDYPPIYIYVLFIVGKLASITALSKYTYLLLKVPSIIADIVSAYFIYKIAKKHISRELSIMLGAFYIFNPAVIINSTIWGQADSLFTLILVLAVYLLYENKIVFSTIFFTALVLMKPQGIIFLPLLLFKYVSDMNIKTVLKSVATGIITGIAIILPFSISNGFGWIFNLYLKGVSEYPYASVNAFNFFSLIGANKVNYSTKFLMLNYHAWGTIAIVFVTIFAGFIYLKGNGQKAAFLSALIEIVGVFNFSTGMHERYMFTAAALAIFTFIYYRDKNLLILSGLFTIIIYINTHVALFNQFNNINSIEYNAVTIITSLLNVLSFVYLAVTAVKLVLKEKSHNFYTKF